MSSMFLPIVHGYKMKKIYMSLVLPNVTKCFFQTLLTQVIRLLLYIWLCVIIVTYKCQCATSGHGVICRIEVKNHWKIFPVFI